MGAGIVSLIVFIVVTIIVNVPMRRPISEALVAAFVACALVGGLQAPELIVNGMLGASQSEVTFAGMAFVFMSLVISSTGLIRRLIDILNSTFGGVRGGPGYVSTLGSAMVGMVAGSTAGNTATVGSITIPWMKRNGWSPEKSATLVAGNSGLGVALPPNSTMFILLAMPAAAGATGGSVYVALLVAGSYCVLYRMAVVWLWSRGSDSRPLPKSERVPLRESLARGWQSTLIFLGVVLPVVITFGPLSTWLSQPGILGESTSNISIIVWVPLLVTAFALVEGRRNLPSARELGSRIIGEIPQFATVGISLFAALAAAHVMEALGLGEQLAGFMTSLDVSPALMVLLVCVIVVIVATPLSATATAAAIGAPSIYALTSIGVDPTIAIVTLLLCASTEGASPPIGAPLFMAAGFAKAKPVKMFVPLTVWFVVPMAAIAWLVGMGWLPIPA
ncbi:TRAP transporter large permease subunit [Nocardiopsis sp. NPDC006938]|uniref:TRAP transporter large permease subunit n=1 Tax=Nocardiopsis sp. NPDC006938 TaxID=3364337 RepID=UPI00367A4417